jgi:hypothetical protein
MELIPALRQFIYETLIVVLFHCSSVVHESGKACYPSVAFEEMFFRARFAIRNGRFHIPGSLPLPA